MSYSTFSPQKQQNHQSQHMDVSTYYSPQKQRPVMDNSNSGMRHSYTVTTATKSVMSSPQRIPGFSQTHEIPLDPRAQYTISYVPGMSEHSIETGKTFEEAKLKIVTLVCELEKVNTYNYTLVRENEVLRVQANKSEREKDLETKLAIVLAENEKLNRIIEEVYEVYMSSRNTTVVNHEYEHRITELYADLEQWKKKYNALEGQNNVVELQHTIQDLKHQKDMLSEQLLRKDRDLEAMRARLNSLGALEVNTQDLNQRLSLLSAENMSLHKELDAMKLQYGKADSLQLKIASYDNKIRTVLDENEKLNALLRAKVEEVRDLKEKLAHASHQHAEISVTLNRQAEEHHKSSAVNQKEIANRMQSLAQENDQLQHELDKLHHDLGDRENHILMITQKLTESERKSQGRQDMEAQLHRLMHEKKELEERGVKIASEVDRLQAIIRDLRGEVEQWKHKASHFETYKFASDKELEEIRRQFEAVKAMNLQNKEFQAKFGAERTAYETQIHQMSQIINDLERKSQMLSAENERVSTLSVQRLSALEELKRNNNEEKYRLEVHGLRNQMEMIKNHAIDAEQIAVQYSNQRSVDQSKIAELTQLVHGYKAESDNLKNLLEKRKYEVDSLTHQNEDLKHMCEKLNQNRMSSSGVKAESIEIMQNKISELEISRNEYQRQAERNSLELSRKNKELVDKIHDMDVLKLRYEEALANYQALNSQLFSKMSVKY